MIKSSTSSLKYSNTGKLNQLHSFIDEYRTVVSRFIDLLWDQDKVAALLPKETTDLVQTWLTARMIQCAGKQASGIVRGTKVKQERRIYIQNKLTKEGQFRKAKKLQRIINQTNVSKPNILHVCPELDSRFVDIDLDNETIFDGWIHLSCIGDKTLLDIPFKKSSHFNKMLNKGSIKTGIRLSKKQITFMFDLPEVELKSSGETLGIDVGQTTVISCSDSQVSRVNFHGYDLASITRLLSRKKKGSKKFLACQAHRKNYINWSINQINFNGVKELKLENIRDMRKYKKNKSHVKSLDLYYYLFKVGVKMSGAWCPSNLHFTNLHK